MTDAPVIITKTRRGPIENDFPYSEGDIPVTGKRQIDEYKQKAWAVYRQIPFPSDKDEAWRRSSLTILDKGRVIVVPDNRQEISIPEEFRSAAIEGEQAGRLEISNGRMQVSISRSYTDQGVIFADLSHAISLHPDLVGKLTGSLVAPNDGKFAALSSAMAVHGTFLYVPAGVKVEQPLHSLIWNEGENSAFFSHSIVVLEAGAEVTFVQEYGSRSGLTGQQFHSGILEVAIGANASLKMVELQSWGKETVNIMHEKVKVGNDAKLDWIFGSLGSRFTKSFSSVDLDGRGATAKVSGFYFADESQHLDMDTEQNHNAPNTTSDLLYKGAVTGNARSVWQGNIYVATGADKTDGYQSNRNLILSRSARADSIPGLEILADDVKCTHGATVGKVDQEQIFYLKSRGLPESEARHLIVEGFFEAIMDRIPFPSVQNRFRNAIIEKINSGINFGGL